LKVTADGKGVASNVGTRLLAEMADNAGLTDALSEALAPMCKRRRRHDPGRVIADLAVTIASGGDALSHLVALRNQPAVFGAVASVPTAFRVVDAIDDTLLARVRAARAKVRRGVWAAGLNPVTECGYVTLDFDATLLEAHSDKEQAAPTYKKGFGFFPLGAWLDNTAEALAAILRPGNAGANTASDHMAVLEEALAQLPVRPRGLDPLNGVPMLVRADSAGATHDFLNALRAKGIEFSVGADITEAVRLAILDVPKTAWVEAVDQDYELREGAQVAELTDLLDLSGWPAGTRAIVRREEPHAGAHFTLFDPEGWRYQVFLTDSPDGDLAYLEARHRGHARVEDRIRCAKDTGLRNLPFFEFANNAVWVEVVPSPATSSPGPRACASKASSPRPSPRRCASCCSTWPGAWYGEAAPSTFASRRTGRGPLISPGPSRRCGAWPSPPDTSRHPGFTGRRLVQRAPNPGCMP
jgi:hypothetical protein